MIQSAFTCGPLENRVVFLHFHLTAGEIEAHGRAEILCTEISCRLVTPTLRSTGSLIGSCSTRSANARTLGNQCPLVSQCVTPPFLLQTRRPMAMGANRQGCDTGLMLQPLIVPVSSCQLSDDLECRVIRHQLLCSTHYHITTNNFIRYYECKCAFLILIFPKSECNL